MRVLLDECVPESFRRHLPPYDIQTCRYAGLAGLTNGNLLRAAEAARFDVLVTVDQNLPYQQRVVGRTISLLVMRTQGTSLPDLLRLLRELFKALEALQPGSLVYVSEDKDP